MKNSAKLMLSAALIAAVTASCVVATNVKSGLGSTSFVKKAAPAPKKLPKLLDLGSDRCIPCKRMVPVLDELKKDYKGKLEVQFIDVWKNTDAGKKYKINVIPTQIFYDASGKEVDRHQGYISKDDIIKKFREHNIRL